jgi:HEAT repeats
MKRGTRTENLQSPVAWLAVGVMLSGLLPTSAHGFNAGSGQRPGTGEAHEFVAQDATADAQIEAEQDQRDREQEARDREEEKKQREQEKIEHVQELYDNGRDDLDEERYDRAIAKFTELTRIYQENAQKSTPLAQASAAQADAALYWIAFAQNKEGKRDAALATIAELKKEFPQSRWRKDAEALEIEVRQGTGQAVNPDTTNDSDLKALALQGIMNGDPQRGIPLIEKYLSGSASPKDKSKALFVLAQNGSPQSQEVLARIARGQSNPDLQRKAIEYLGMFGSAHSRDMLADIYASSNDPAMKRTVIHAYMLSGDREHILALAKGEKNDELRSAAIHNLGLTGGTNELEQLYLTESSTEAKKEILQALFLSGDSRKLAQVAQEEKDPELRREAVRCLGLQGGRQPELQSIYTKDPDRRVKEEVLNAYFIGGNASGLVAIARAEKDPELKKKAVEKLSVMGSKEANDYLMELLQK